MNGDVSWKALLWYFALAICYFGYIHWSFEVDISLSSYHVTTLLTRGWVMRIITK